MKKFFALLLCIGGLLSTALAHSGEEECALIVCDNGLEMFHWNKEFIRHACHSIELSIAFFGGEVAQELLRTVEAQLSQEEGLQVFILTTPMISELEDLHYLERLLAAYPDRFHLLYTSMVPLLLPDVGAIENHTKLCVVDGYYFSLGGSNLADGQVVEGTFTPPPHHRQNKMTKGLAAGHRDQDIVGRGAAIAEELRRTFYQMYALWEAYQESQCLEKDPALFADNGYYQPCPAHPWVEKFEYNPEKKEVARGALTFLLSGPHQKKNSITEEYIRLIRAAKEEILLANVYLFPVEEVMEALCDAVARGVRLRVVTNGLWKEAPKPNYLFAWANRLSYVPLLYGKEYHWWERPSGLEKKATQTRIYEYAVPDILVHKKVMLVDGYLFAIGSYNLCPKSHSCDYELLLVVDSAAVGEAAARVFARDVQYSREVSPQEAVSWYFNPLIAYMGTLQRRLGHGLM